MDEFKRVIYEYIGIVWKSLGKCERWIINVRGVFYSMYSIEYCRFKFLEKNFPALISRDGYSGFFYTIRIQKYIHRWKVFQHIPETCL